MDTFLFSFVLVAALSFGARDQLLVAQLSDALARGEARQNRPLPLLVIASMTAALAAALMAYAGAQLTAILPPRAGQMLIAFALAIAAFELAWPVKVKPVREPTTNAIAVGAVLLWRQVSDAARFAVFALAAAATIPPTAFIGGALGGGVAVWVGWSQGAARLGQIPFRYLRLALAVCLFVAALFIGLNARYAIY